MVCNAECSPPGVTDSPPNLFRIWATLAIGTPNPTRSQAASACATGPSITPAAPNASEVWSGCRDRTLRRQSVQWPNATW